MDKTTLPSHELRSQLAKAFQLGYDMGKNHGMQVASDRARHAVEFDAAVRDLHRSVKSDGTYETPA